MADPAPSVTDSEDAYDLLRVQVRYPAAARNLCPARRPRRRLPRRSTPSVMTSCTEPLRTRWTGCGRQARGDGAAVDPPALSLALSMVDAITESPDRSRASAPGTSYGSRGLHVQPIVGEQGADLRNPADNAGESVVIATDHPQRLSRSTNHRLEDGVARRVATTAKPARSYVRRTPA